MANSKIRNQKIQQFKNQVLHYASVVGILKTIPSNNISLLEAHVLYLDQLVQKYSLDNLDPYQYTLLNAQIKSNFNWIQYNLDTL